MIEVPAPIPTLHTIRRFVRVGTCSETLCSVLDEAYRHRLPAEEKASAPLAGGILAHGYQCGQVWGGALAGGAEAFRRFGPGPEAEAAAVAAARGVVRSFSERYGSIECRAITRVDFSSGSWTTLFGYFAKNGLRCFRMAGEFAPVALAEIEAALAVPVETPPAPVSCAAETARRMGASDLHVVMAASLAGGVGLSGSACGALATAAWLTDLDDRRRGDAPVGFKSATIPALIERYFGCTEGRFSCAEVVGRLFESLSDHAAYLREGGCAGVIATVAAS